MTEQPGSRTVLIAGASGVIGAAAIEHFAQLPGWKVIGVSRRPADVSPDVAYEHVAVDLTDPAACRAAAERFAGVTHVVYAALFEKPGLVPGWREQDQMQTNLAMMRNLMDPLLAAAKGLAHVSVLQGTKAYGVHVHPIRIPCRENRPRDQHENFYWLQEDYIRAAQKGSDWSFTILRPQVVFGGATGVAMNLIPIIGAYAAICRELGRTFACPATIPGVLEAVDADLIARALAWAAEAPNARGETFNISLRVGERLAGDRRGRRTGAGLWRLGRAFGLFAGTRGGVGQGGQEAQPAADPDGQAGRGIAPLRRLRLRLRRGRGRAGVPGQHHQTAPGRVRRLRRHRGDVQDLAQAAGRPRGDPAALTTRACHINRLSKFDLAQ